jgi:transcriptional regulator with XRE-family HTH domain
VTGNELRFRNVDAAADDAVESWPVEAITTALERGSLRHWSRIAAAVRRDPWGPVTRCLEQALECVEPYGLAPGMRRVIDSSRRNRQAAERGAVAAQLRRLLDESGLTASQFASRMGTSASRLSTYLSGTVSPSAALVVRAHRIARTAAASPTLIISRGTQSAYGRWVDQGLVFEPAEDIDILAPVEGVSVSAEALRAELGSEH